MNRGARRLAIQGALWCFLLSFVALPVALGIVDQSFEWALMAPLLMIWLGILGGFPLLAILGGAAGLFIHARHGRADLTAEKATFIASAALAFAATFTYAILDKLFNPF